MGWYHAIQMLEGRYVLLFGLHVVCITDDVVVCCCVGRIVKFCDTSCAHHIGTYVFIWQCGFRLVYIISY